MSTVQDTSNVSSLFGAGAAIGLLWHPLPGLAHKTALRLTVAFGLLGAALLGAGYLMAARLATEKESMLGRLRGRVRKEGSEDW